MRGKEGSRQLSVWLHEPLAASKVIKHADAERQGRMMVFLPLLQLTFYVTAVSHPETTHLFRTAALFAHRLGRKNKRLETREEEAGRFLSDPAVIPQIW